MPAREPSVLVYNEMTKLTAIALDRASTGFGVGAVLPLLNGWRTATQGNIDLRAEAWTLVVSTVGYLFASAVLHWGARLVLRELKS